MKKVNEENEGVTDGVEIAYVRSPVDFIYPRVLEANGRPFPRLCSNRPTKMEDKRETGIWQEMKTGGGRKGTRMDVRSRKCDNSLNYPHVFKRK